MEYQLIENLVLPKNYTLVEQIFANRGITPENLTHYLNTTDEDILNPLLLDNIEEGAKILIQHIAKLEPILVIVDSDCDGFTSAALLINYLNKHFPGYTQNYIYYNLHSGKQHGLEDQMEYLDAHKEFKLIICPDSASNNYDYHKTLYDEGRQVLVLDHHEAEYVSPHACVINNQLCNYPTKSLSGVGIVYKFCCYIDSIMNTNYAPEFMDLVAVGITGDMMSLKDYETRHLVKTGLLELHNPYIKQMVKTQTYSIERKGGLCPFTVSFYVVPQVNATIRMGTAEEKLLLFESMLDFKGYEKIPSTKRGCKGQEETKVEQACRNCTNIKNRQTKARDASLNIIEQKIKEQNLLDHKILAVRLDDNNPIDKNLTGLVANQVMAKYQRPVLILSKTSRGWEGSGRGYGKSKMDNFREFLVESGLALYGEGHAQAFGAGIGDTEFDNFITYSDEALKDFDFSPCYKVDKIYQSNDIKNDEILSVAQLGTIWGQEVDEPFIAIENIKITKDNCVLRSPDKYPTLNITLPNGISLVKFGSSKEEYESLYTELGCVTINVVGKCSINEWNGVISPQIEIEEYEIVNKTQYYF